MGWRRRRMGLIVVLIGLGTFVAPLIETDSESLGRIRWSPFAIVLAVHDGRLPIHEADSHYAVSSEFDVLLGIGAVYFLLALLAALIAFSPSARFVGSASAVGLAWVFSDARHGYLDLRNVIYGEPWGVHAQDPRRILQLDPMWSARSVVLYSRDETT